MFVVIIFYSNYMYTIDPYTYNQAEKIKVIVKPSKKANKKIDVFDARDEQYITSVGDIRYGDYPTYLRTRGEEYANKRRKAFHKRFKTENITPYTNIYYSAKLLW